MRRTSSSVSAPPASASCRRRGTEPSKQTKRAFGCSRSTMDAAHPGSCTFWLVGRLPMGPPRSRRVNPVGRVPGARPRTRVLPTVQALQATARTRSLVRSSWRTTSSMGTARLHVTETGIAGEKGRRETFDDEPPPVPKGHADGDHRARHMTECARATWRRERERERERDVVHVTRVSPFPTMSAGAFSSIETRPSQNTIQITIAMMIETKALPMRARTRARFLQSAAVSCLCTAFPLVKQETNVEWIPVAVDGERSRF